MGKSGGFNLDVPYSSRLQQQQQHASSIGSGGPPSIGPLLLPPQLPQSFFLFTWVQPLIVPPWSLTTAPGILKWVFPVTWSRASLPRQLLLSTSRFWIKIGAPPTQAIRLFTARFIIGMSWRDFGSRVYLIIWDVIRRITTFFWREVHSLPRRAVNTLVKLCLKPSNVPGLYIAVQPVLAHVTGYTTSKCEMTEEDLGSFTAD